jgi:hypothetical protein
MTKVKKYTSYSICGLFFVLMIVLATPMAVNGQSDNAVQKLASRAMDRWTSLLEQRLSDAYQYESPAYRKIIDVENYKAGFGGTIEWLSAEVVNAEILEPGESAEVSVNLSYQIHRPLAGTIKYRRVIKEVWVMQDDEWWHLTE